MSYIQLSLEGLDETHIKIDRNNHELVRDLEAIVYRGADRMETTARRHAPVGRTRNLVTSIRKKDVSKILNVPDRLRKTVTARKAKGNHLHLNELGTRERIQNTSRRMTGRMSARPFMAVAEAEAMPPYVREVESRIRREVII